MGARVPSKGMDRTGTGREQDVDRSSRHRSIVSPLPPKEIRAKTANAELRSREHPGERSRALGRGRRIGRLRSLINVAALCSALSGAAWASEPQAPAETTAPQAAALLSSICL